MRDWIDDYLSQMQKYSTSIAFLGIRIGIPTSYITERALEFRLVRLKQKLVCTERCIFRCKRLRETRSVEQRQPGGGIHFALPNRQTLPRAFTRRSNETKTNRGYRTCWINLEPRAMLKLCTSFPYALYYVGLHPLPSATRLNSKIVV